MKKPGAYDSFVANMAVMDTIMVPDSTSSRPNCDTLEDRPRTCNPPSTAFETNINVYQPERTHWRNK